MKLLNGAASGSGSLEKPTRKGRSEAREARAGKFKVLKGEFYLKNRSVRPATLAAYRLRAAEFDSWCKSRRLASTSIQQFDVAMARYLDYLFFEGEHIGTARYTVWGTKFVRGMSLYRRDFPILYKQLDGWKNAAPVPSKDPLTCEAMLIFANAMLTIASHLGQEKSKRGVEKLSKLRPEKFLQAACALPIQFDGYFRPNEIVSVRICDVSVRTNPARGVPVVIRASADTHEGTSLDVARARASVVQAKPAKTGEYDGTVLLGDASSKAADRQWVGKLLLRIVAARSSAAHAPSEKIFDLTVGEYEQVFRDTASFLGLERLEVTPHSARHGGASYDCYYAVRSLEEIQQCGQWASQKSVARYRKAGMYCRQNDKLSKIELASAQQLCASLPPLLMRTALKF